MCVTEQVNHPELARGFTWCKEIQELLKNIHLCCAGVTSLHPPSPVIALRSLVPPVVGAMTPASDWPLPPVVPWDPLYLP